MVFTYENVRSGNDLANNLVQPRARPGNTVDNVLLKVIVEAGLIRTILVYKNK